MDISNGNLILKLLKNTGAIGYNDRRWLYNEGG
jgi:hypothetical protein